MKVRVFWMLCLLGTLEIYCQELISVSGKVIDQEYKEALKFATVSIKNSPLGTVTNADGYFEFEIPEQYKNDTILVSHIGFHSYETLVSTCPDSTIELKSNPVQLEEIVVQTKLPGANQIVRKAFDQIRANFSQEPYLLKGFFRQLSLEDEKYVLLVEAAFDWYDEKYKLQKKFDLKEKVAIQQVRASHNYFNNQNLNFFDGTNPLKLLINWNYTRYENSYLTSRENFQLDSILKLDTAVVYKVSSSFQNEKLSNLFTLYINAEDFSFIKIKNQNEAFDDEYLGFSPLLTDRSKLVGMKSSSQEYQFTVFEGLSYLHRCISENTAEIVDRKSGKVERVVSDENLLVITEIQTDGITIPKTGLMNPMLNIKDQDFQYNQEFWQDGNQVQLTPLSNRQKRDLERKLPMEKQFLQTSPQ